MRRNFPSRRKALALGVVMAGFALPAAAQDDDAGVEEILVTGSYIRGAPQDAPSPVNVIDRDSIEAQGASVIWDVIRNMEVNSGSDTSVSGSSDAGQLTGTAQVNLRNLGGNSTLTLINGKRFTAAAVNGSSGQEFVNLNNIPLVMTERIEVLTDGGSALYGSDAVAGVVNIIMRTEFEGLELYADVQGVVEAGDKFDKTISGIWGWSSDSGDTHFVISGERFERDPVGIENANFYDSTSGSYNGTVGNLGTPLELPGSTINPDYVRQDLTDRNIAEGGSSSTVLGDPLCGTFDGPNGPYYSDNRYSDLGENHARCQESTVDYSYLATGAERTSFAAAFNHTFSDAAEFYSFANYSTADTQIERDGNTFSRSIHVYLPPPGTHDPAVGGFLATVFQPFELGYFAPNIGLTRPTADDITNSPLDARNGGLGTAMYGGLTTGWPRVGETYETLNEDTGVQVGLRGEFFAGDRRLNYDVGYSWSSSSVEQNVNTLRRDRAELALQGLGGPDCTPNGDKNFDWEGADPFGAAMPILSNSFANVPFPGYILNLRESYALGLTSNNQGQGGCQFWNPFMTALNGDPTLENSQELVDWMEQDIKRNDKRNKLAVFDAVVSGELFEMRGGTAQFAAGGQYRDVSRRSRANPLNFPGIPDAITSYEEVDGVRVPQREYITNNLECAGCTFTYDHERDVSAVFFELSLPFLENIETQVAVRYEDYGGNIGANTSPKVAMSWRPLESLLLRASYSQSFRAPNIGIIHESFDSFGTVVQDPISNDRVRAGIDPATNENSDAEFSYTQGAPNPNIGNEEAETFNIGFQWTPAGRLDGLSVGADVWQFEVSDRVLPQVPRAALQPQVDKFIEVSQDQGNYVFGESIEPDAVPRFVSCSPAALNAEFGEDSDERLDCMVDPRLYDLDGDGIQRLPGDPNASIVTIVLPAINAGNMTVNGIDFSMGYSWDNDWGRWRISTNYTHVNEYLVEDIPGLDLGLRETGIIDAAGTNGDTPMVRTLPDNKGNITMSWARDNHRVTVINRHIGSFKILDYEARLDNTNVSLVPHLKKDSPSYSSWDINYNYTADWGNSALGSTTFTLGILDATNEDLPMYAFQTFDRSVFDGRGRRWYARALWSF